MIIKEKLELILSHKTVTYLFFFLVSFMLYSQAIHFEAFIFDDNMLIFHNDRITKPSFSHFFHYWGNSKTPLSFNLWQVLSLIAGGTTSKVIFHFVSILLHALNSFLVFTVVKNIFIKIIPKISDYKYQKNKHDWAFLLAGIYFMIHPITTEAVVWISSSKHLLAMAFGLSAINFYLQSIDCQKINEFNRLRILTFVFYLLSILSSAITLSLLIVFVLCDLFILGKNTKSFVINNLPYFILLYFFWRTYEVSGSFKTYNNLEEETLAILYNIKHYLFHIVLPFKLQFMYPITIEKVVEKYSSGYGLFSLLSTAIAFFGYIIFTLVKKRFDYFSLGLVCFLILILPSLGFVQIYFQSFSLVADRFTYFALLGPCIIIAGLGLKFEKGKYFNGTVLGVLVLSFMLSFSNIGFWKKENIIFEKAVDTLWSSARINSYAYQLMKKGNYQKAEKLFLKISNQHEEAHFHLITLYNLWGTRKMIGKYLQSRYGSFNADELNIPLDYVLPLAHLFLTVGDYPSTFAIFNRVAKENLPIDKGDLGKLLNRLESMLLNEPFNSFITLGDIFTYQKQYKRAEDFYIYATPFGDKNLVGQRIKRLQEINKKEIHIKNNPKVWPTYKDPNSNHIPKNKIKISN